MNHAKLIRYFLIFAVTMLYSCGGDDDDLTNIVKFDGSQYKLYKGYQFKGGETLSTGSTPFVVILLGEGVSYDHATEKISGIGSSMIFTMYSENSAEIAQGLYTIDIFSKDSSFSAGECEILFNYDFEQDTGVCYNVNAGTFDVRNLGSIMKYNINVVAGDTMFFSGIFKGPVSML